MFKNIRWPEFYSYLKWGPQFYRCHWNNWPQVLVYSNTWPLAPRTRCPYQSQINLQNYLAILIWSLLEPINDSLYWRSPTTHTKLQAHSGPCLYLWLHLLSCPLVNSCWQAVPVLSWRGLLIQTLLNFQTLFQIFPLAPKEKPSPNNMCSLPIPLSKFLKKVLSQVW